MEEFYKMDHKNRGYAVIINNFRFTISLEEGQKQDVINYKKLFKVLGFKEHEIKVYENKTIEEMQKIMKKYANEIDYTDCDCFIAVFLSHGKLHHNQQYIYGIDQSMKFHEHCTDVFKKTKTLIHKPKIFFIDLCRGKQEEPSYSKSLDNILTNNKIETTETVTKYN